MRKSRAKLPLGWEWRTVSFVGGFDGYDELVDERGRSLAYIKYPMQRPARWHTMADGDRRKEGICLDGRRSTARRCAAAACREDVAAMRRE